MPTITFTAGFNLRLSPKQWIFNDTTNYGVIPLADVNGNFTIYRGTSAAGTPLYTNTDFSNARCDIRNGVSRANQDVIQATLDIPTGLPMTGNYYIVYTVFNSNLNEYYTANLTINNQYVRPAVCISQTADCVAPLFTSTDITDYVVSGITPTIDRTHTLRYPTDSAGYPDPTVTSAAVITRGANEFFNGVQTTLISSDLGYVFSNYYVVDTITGEKNFTVDCTSLCKLYCCLRSLAKQMTNAVYGSDLYNALGAKFSIVMGLVELAEQATYCGKGTDISGYVSTIQAITECNDDCGCTDGAASPVVGTGSIINNVIVESGDSYIRVEAVVGGNTTTYTVTLSTTFITQVNTNTANIGILQGEVALMTTEISALLLANEYSDITSVDNSVAVTRTLNTIGAILLPGSFGYVVNDVITAMGGTHSTVMEITVDTVDGMGKILTYHISQSGVYSVLPTNPVTFSGGTGVNAFFTIVWSKYYDLSVPAQHRTQTFSWASYDGSDMVNYLLCSATIGYQGTPNAQFIYGGTDKEGTITYAKVNGWSSNGTANVTVKLRDITNALDIGEVNIGTTTDQTTIIDFGALSNLPTAPAIFGVFVKTNSAVRDDSGALASITLGYA